MTIGQWVGTIGLAFFTVVLIWSLVQWHKSPPER